MISFLVSLSFLPYLFSIQKICSLFLYFQEENQFFLFGLILFGSLTEDWARDDMVYDALKKPDGERKPLPIDEDLPGMGQYYCLHCEYVFVFVFFFQLFFLLTNIF
jgi:hypothetical protein